MKKYNYLTIIGSIITIIAFITPAAISSKDGELFWIWGFKMKKSLKMVNNIPAFNLSIICSVVILICIIISIVILIKYKDVKNRDYGWVWIITGIIIALTTIIWSIAINFLLSTKVETEDEFGYTSIDYIYFWETHYIGFGVIGLIIGGIFIVIAGFIASLSGDTTIAKIPIVKKTEAQPIRSQAKKYCLFCGAQVSPDSKFCNGCGNQIE